MCFQDPGAAADAKHGMMSRHHLQAKAHCRRAFRQCHEAATLKATTIAMHSGNAAPGVPR
jgi:hypothetical protein